MRLKLLFSLLILVGFSAATLTAADFWKTKKFSEWTDKEVQKMVRDSPWARPVELTLGGASLAPGGGRGGRRGGGGGGGGGGIAQASARGSDDEGSSGGREPEPGGQSAPVISVIVRCHSALPIKQAVVRARYGNEVLSSPEAAKILARQETGYIWSVSGLPPQMAKADPAELKAFLKPKGKPPIQAQEIRPDASGGLVSLFLFFPRAGNPITLEDREVEVLVKLPRGDVRRVFKLKDMVYEGKLEI